MYTCIGVVDYICKKIKNFHIFVNYAEKRVNASVNEWTMQIVYLPTLKMDIRTIHSRIRKKNNLIASLSFIHSLRPAINKEKHFSFSV